MTLKKRKNSFTLLEIFICISILAVAASFIGWQMKNLIASHHFHQNVSNLITDLKKCQLLALSDRMDIEMKIFKQGDVFVYILHTDEPIALFSKHPKEIKGIRAIFQEKKEINTLIIPIYSSGRIEKKEKIRLYQNKDQGVELDFSKPHLIIQSTIKEA